MPVPTPALDRSGLIAALARLTSEGGNGNRGIWSRGDAFFVISGEVGGRALTVEAAPSRLLSDGRKLTLEAVQRLRGAGFANRPSQKALARHVALDRPDALGDLVDQLDGVLTEVYQVSGEDSVSFHLGPAEPTTNPGLVDAMRNMAKKREHRLRTELYRSMLDSRLLLVVDAPGPSDGAGSPEDQGDPPLRPRVVGQLARWDVVAAFTDLGALRRWDLRAPPYQAVKGRALFPALAAMPRLGSLLLNPGGTVGGELYRNEIETLAEACHRRVRTSAR